ncbi:hypothetical protein ADK35_31240 [Streptomyces viridochromogenes]|nr:hypothetical protein ADK35_31240 [Streptomyces viridochromogenes]
MVSRSGSRRSPPRSTTFPVQWAGMASAADLAGWPIRNTVSGSSWGMSAPICPLRSTRSGRQLMTTCNGRWIAPSSSSCLMFISVDSGSLAAKTFANRSRFPSGVRYRSTESTPGSGGASYIPFSAVARSTPSSSATASAMATFSLKVNQLKPRSSSSVTVSGSA